MASLKALINKAEHEGEEWGEDFAEFSWKGRVGAKQPPQNDQSHPSGAAQAGIPEQEALEEFGPQQQQENSSDHPRAAEPPQPFTAL